MRIDSCRTCGKDMKEFQRCDTCNEVISLICKVCNKSSEEQVHMDCGSFGTTLILN